MNQIELNKVALNFLRNQSFEVAKKLEKVLAQDLQEKGSEIPGSTIHHIHNIALFDLLLMINSIFTIKDKSSATAEEYCKLGESLQPKFLEIVEELKDFQPSVQSNNNEETNK